MKDFAPDVDGDLFRQVAVGDGDGHLRDIADLRRQVTGHLVDGVGEFFPHAARPFDLGLAAELSFRPDLARHARDFRREDCQLLDHLVDKLRAAKEFSLERTPVLVQRHRLAEVALTDGTDRAGHLGRWRRQVVDQRVE